MKAIMAVRWSPFQSRWPSAANPIAALMLIPVHQPQEYGVIICVRKAKTPPPQAQESQRFACRSPPPLEGAESIRFAVERLFTSHFRVTRGLWRLRHNTGNIRAFTPIFAGSWCPATGRCARDRVGGLRADWGGAKRLPATQVGFTRLAHTHKKTDLGPARDRRTLREFQFHE